MKYLIIIFIMLQLSCTEEDGGLPTNTVMINNEIELEIINATWNYYNHKPDSIQLEVILDQGEDVGTSLNLHFGYIPAIVDKNHLFRVDNSIPVGQQVTPYSEIIGVYQGDVISETYILLSDHENTLTINTINDKEVKGSFDLIHVISYQYSFGKEFDYLPDTIHLVCDRLIAKIR